MTSAHPRELSDKHCLRGEIRVGSRGCLRLQSDNSGMARAFKELTGNITKLNEPHFVADRGLWVMMVKENDRWIAINSLDEQKIRLRISAARGMQHSLGLFPCASQMMDCDMRPALMTAGNLLASFPARWGLRSSRAPSLLISVSWTPSQTSIASIRPVT